MPPLPKSSATTPGEFVKHVKTAQRRMPVVGASDSRRGGRVPGLAWRRRTSPAAGASAPLSVDLAGDASLDRGPGPVRQHDQTFELFARHLVSVPAFLRRRGSVGRYAQEALGTR